MALPGFVAEDDNAMAELARAEELVRAMERDGAFRAAVEAAPTIAAKRAVLDARGFADVGLADMRAWVESKGGTLPVAPGDRELSEEELAAVAGGLTPLEQVGIATGALVVVLASATAAV